MPNIPQAIVVFLACASIGAIWSSCSPDMGSASVLDRFRQIPGQIADFGADKVFDGANDLVVDYKSMTQMGRFTVPVADVTRTRSLWCATRWRWCCREAAASA